MNRLLFILILLLPFTSNAEIKIVSSITPLSSLASMILGNKGTVSTIASNQGCPHHYALKPSDLAKVEDADFFIYIDKNFDIFATNLLSKFHKQKLEISSLSNIKIYNNNFHLWLLPENAIIILTAITDALIKLSPEDKIYFKAQLNKHIKQMKNLETKRQQIVATKDNIIILSDSAEYIFSGFIHSKNYESSEYSSLKSNQKLQKLAEDKDKCFILSSDQNIEKYNKLLNNKAISLATENWEESEDLAMLYYNEYAKIISQIKQECSR